MTATSSQQVSFWSVHERVAPLLEQVEAWPTVGTPAWCTLDDHDPVKLAALFDAAQHWALRVETNQRALAEASRDVAAAADWPGIAHAVRRHADATTSGAYIAHGERA
jgi:hypothetical protein